MQIQDPQMEQSLIPAFYFCHFTIDLGTSPARFDIIRYDQVYSGFDEYIDILVTNKMRSKKKENQCFHFSIESGFLLILEKRMHWLPIVGKNEKGLNLSTILFINYSVYQFVDLYQLVDLSTCRFFDLQIFRPVDLSTARMKTLKPISQHCC